MDEVERCSSPRAVGKTPTTTHVAMTVRVVLPATLGFVCRQAKITSETGVTHGFRYPPVNEQIYYKLQVAS